MTSSRSVLKSYFESGDRPNQLQYAELIDSLLHVDDTINANVAEFAAVNPSTTDPNFAPAMQWDFSSDSRTTNPNYSVHAGLSMVYASTNGKNFPDLSGKTTFIPKMVTHDATAWGQKFIFGYTINAWGNGDAIIGDSTINVFGGVDAQGDEGAKRDRVVIRQGQSLQVTTIASVAKATINTTTTQAISESKDVQTVTVSSTSGVSVGQWIIVEGGAPSSDEFNRGEAVKVTAVSAGTISGVFSHDHASGVSIRGATVLGLNYVYQWGQGRYCINLSATPYTTGTARGVGTVGSPSSRIDGTGTSWANNMVGGDSENPGAISFSLDDYSGAPYSPSTLRAWYPIASVSTASSLFVFRRDAVGIAPYTGKQTTSAAYTIRPAARIMAIEGAVVVLDHNTFTWTVGQTVECAHSTSLEISCGTYDVEFYTPGQTYRNMWSLYNTGTQDFAYGLIIGPLGSGGGGYTTCATFAGKKWGIEVQGGANGVSGAAAMQITANSFYAGRIQWGTGIVGVEYDFTLDSLELNFGDGYGGGMISRRDGLGQRNIEYNGGLDLKQTANFVKPKMGLEGFNSRHFYWQASDYASNNYLVFHAGLLGAEVPIWRYATTGIELIPSADATFGANLSSSQFVFIANVWDGSASSEKRWTASIEPASNATNAKQHWRLKRPTSNSAYPATVLDIDSDGKLIIGTQNFASGVEQDKACVFDPTGITPGQTRIISIPDQSGTIALTDSAGNLAVNGGFTLAIKTIGTLPAAASVPGRRFQVTDSTPPYRSVFSSGTAFFYEDGSTV